MKIRNLARLMSLLMITSLCLSSCNDDPDPEDPTPTPQPTTVTIKAVTENGEAVKGITIYMFSEDGYSNSQSKNNALSFENTNDNGTATFEIKSEDLNGTYKKNIIFAITQSNDDLCEHKIVVALKEGDKVEQEMTIPNDDKPAPQINISEVSVTGQDNGQIIIDGKLTANAKIKKLVLSSDAEGKNVIADLLTIGEQSSIKTIQEAGENGKTFTLSIPTVAVDVATMYLYAETNSGQNTAKASVAITETIRYSIGSSKSATMGSYLSIINNKTMMLSDAKNASAEVIGASSEDGYSVIGLIKATNAKSADVASRAGKVALFQEGINVNEIKEGGIIFTESGAICKIGAFQNTGSGEATFDGITIKAGLGDVKSVSTSIIGTLPAPFEAQIDFENIKVLAQPNGQIIVDGNVTANTKIKSLVLSTDDKGKQVVVDLLKAGELSKIAAINEVGDQGKTFTLSIPTVAVDVQTLFLVGITKEDKIASSQITESIYYNIGAAKSTTIGSYLSIITNRALLLSEAKTSAVEVIAQSSADGYSVISLKKASAANSADVQAKAGKVAFYLNGTSVESIKEEGVIITESGAICKVVKFTNSANGDATFEGITIKAGLGDVKTVDISGSQAYFSK